MKLPKKWSVFLHVVAWFVVEGLKDALDEYAFRRAMDVRKRPRRRRY